jgi:hypothetical protein
LGNKKTRDEMIELAYDLQNAVTALCSKRPLRITTNKDHKLLRIVWMKGYEKKEWYNAAGMKILTAAFTDKYGIQIREITVDECNDSAVYLTKKTTDPERTGR